MEAKRSRIIFLKYFGVVWVITITYSIADEISNTKVSSIEWVINGYAITINIIVVAITILYCSGKIL